MTRRRDRSWILDVILFRVYYFSIIFPNPFRSYRLYFTSLEFKSVDEFRSFIKEGHVFQFRETSFTIEVVTFVCNFKTRGSKILSDFRILF